MTELHLTIKTYCAKCRRAGSKHARDRWRTPPHPDGAPHVGRRWWLFVIRLGGRDGSVVVYRQGYATFDRVQRAARRAYSALDMSLGRSLRSSA